MELVYSFLANSGEVMPDGRFNVLGGGIEGVSASAVPIILPSLAIVVVFNFAPDEIGQEYPVGLSLIQPNGVPSEISGSLLLHPKMPEIASSSTVRLRAMFNVYGLKLSEPGVYQFVFLGQGRQVGSIDFLVAVTPEAETMQHEPQ